MTYKSVAHRIDEVVAFYGGLRKAADAIGIDFGYLSRLRTGNKNNPSEATLQKLGIERIVKIEYRRCATKRQPRTKSAQAQAGE